MHLANGVAYWWSNVDKKGQGLSYKPLDDPVGQSVAVHKAGCHHANGGRMCSDAFKQPLTVPVK